MRGGAGDSCAGCVRHKCRDFKQSIQINQMPARVTNATRLDGCYSYGRLLIRNGRHIRVYVYMYKCLYVQVPSAVQISLGKCVAFVFTKKFVTHTPRGTHTHAHIHHLTHTCLKKQIKNWLTKRKCVNNNCLFIY